MHIDRFPTSAAAINQLNQTDFVSMYFVTSIIKRWIDAPQEGRSSGRIVRLCHQKYPAGFVNSAEDERDEMSDRSGSKDYSLESRYRTVLYPTSILRQTRKWGFLWFTFQLFPGFFFFFLLTLHQINPLSQNQKLNISLAISFLLTRWTGTEFWSLTLKSCFDQIASVGIQMTVGWDYGSWLDGRM